MNEFSKIDIDELTKLASDILSEKENFHISENADMMAQLMECGSSVGGARAKTLIAWNPSTNDIRSGQINAGEGYEYWYQKALEGATAAAMEEWTSQNALDLTYDEQAYAYIQTGTFN